MLAQVFGAPGQAEARPRTIFSPRHPDDICIEAYNMMGGCLDWHALPLVVEIFGIDDVETFVQQLIAIRDFQRKQSEVEHG